MHRVALLTVITLTLAACARATDDPGAPTPVSTATADAAATPDDESEEAPDGSPEEPVGSVTISATDDLTWAKPELTAPAGLLEVTLACGPAVAHTLFIPDVNPDRQLLGCSAGAASTTLVPMDPGTYPYLCTVAGHENMRGTLTIG